VGQDFILLANFQSAFLTRARRLLTTPITLLAQDRLGLRPLPDYYARC
jgi:hypothetical protein